MHRFPRALAAAIALAAITTSACQGAAPTQPSVASNPALAGQKTATVKGTVTTEGVQASAFRIFQAAAPIAGAKVTITSNGVTTEVTTDANGQFAGPAVQGAEAVITATHSDPSGHVFREVTSVQVPTAEEPPIVDVASLVTRRTGSIQGMVQLENGESPEGCDVFIGGTTMVGKVSEKGRFALANVPEGIWDVVVAKPGFGRAVLEDVAVQAGRPQVLADTVVLSAADGGGAGVKAAIRDSSGKAVVGATLTLYAADGASATATSDDQGHVSLADLPDGEYRVQVYRPFYQPYAGPAVTVKAGEPTDLGEIKLTSTTVYFGQTSGQVMDAYGDPVDGAVVMLDPPVTEQIFTDAQGRFTLDRIMPGEYTLHVAAGGMEVTSRELRIDNAPGTKVTFEAPILMRETPPISSAYRIKQAGARMTDLVPPIVEVGTLGDGRVALYWESPDASALPEGLVSVHYEVEHLDNAVGSPESDPVNGDWRPVADRADVSYVLDNAGWSEDDFRVRAVGLDEAGEAYVSDWQEVSLRGQATTAAAAYGVLLVKAPSAKAPPAPAPVSAKAKAKHPDIQKGKPKQPPAAAKPVKKPTQNRGVPVQTKPNVKKPSPAEIKAKALLLKKQQHEAAQKVAAAKLKARAIAQRVRVKPMPESRDKKRIV